MDNECGSDSDQLHSDDQLHLRKNIQWYCFQYIFAGAEDRFTEGISKIKVQKLVSEHNPEGI